MFADLEVIVRRVSSQVKVNSLACVRVRLLNEFTGPSSPMSVMRRLGSSS